MNDSIRDAALGFSLATFGICDENRAIRAYIASFFLNTDFLKSVFKTKDAAYNCEYALNITHRGNIVQFLSLKSSEADIIKTPGKDGVHVTCFHLKVGLLDAAMIRCGL